MKTAQKKEFLIKLEEKLNFVEDEKGEISWTCFSDFRFSKEVLKEMGLEEDELDEFELYCDCEIILNK